jgi:hypothetical protein
VQEEEEEVDKKEETHDDSHGRRKFRSFFESRWMDGVKGIGFMRGGVFEWCISSLERGHADLVVYSYKACE